MKKCSRKMIQTDQRHRTPGKVLNSDTTWPAEWVGHVVVSGKQVTYDGVVVGIVYKVCAGWTGIAPDGTRKRAMSRTEVIRRLLPES